MIKMISRIIALLLFSSPLSHCTITRELQKFKSPCPNKPDLSGFLDVVSFMDALKDGYSDFVLCPGIEYTDSLDLNAGLNESFVISCADWIEVCVWNVKGGSHITYNGTMPLWVSVRGIIFTGAAETSIQISGQTSLRIEFTNCTWRDNKGSSVIQVTDSGNSTTEDSATEGSRARHLSTYRYLSNKATTMNGRSQMTISACVFESNVVSKSIMISDISLLLSNSEFRSNEAGLGIVQLKHERNTMQRLSFEDNIVSESGIIVVDSGANVKTTNICGMNNAVGKFCNGTFFTGTPGADNCQADKTSQSCEKACTSYDECSNDACVATVKNLKSALSVGGDITLCSDTTFDLSAQDEPLQIRNIPVSIMCGKNCVFLGGNQQFRVLDGVTSTSFQNITFKQSLRSSIIIEIDPSEPAFVSFIGCEWSNHDGKHVILLSATDTLQKNEQLEAYVDFRQCLFIDNNVGEYLIVNKGLSLSINACTFRKNVVGDAIVGAITGDTVIGQSQSFGSSNISSTISIEDNEVNTGLFFVGEDNANFELGDVCVRQNIYESSCNGTLLEGSDPNLCQSGEQNSEACNGTCQLINICDNLEDNQCFSEFSALLKAVNALEVGRVFVICPQSELLLGSNDTLSIQTDDTVIRCGEDGLRDNQCSFLGGTVQIRINGTTSGIRLEGISFVGSSDLSVAALGDEQSSATFFDCEFSSHTGEAVMIIYQEDTSLDVVAANLATAGSMQIFIESCVFVNNTVEFASITNLQGDVTISNTFFKSNSGRLGAGAIVSYSSLNVSQSCFIANVGNVSGTILLNASQTFDQKGNYGENNEVIQGNCTDILATDDSLACYRFEGSECLVKPLEAPGSSDTSPSPSLPSLDTPAGPCISGKNWKDLFQSVRDSKGDEAFVLCDETIVDMAKMEGLGLAPLMIQTSGITLECGSARRNGCVLSGGKTHIQLQGQVEKVRILGITMERASSSSVMANLSSPFSIDFQDCEWKNNSGMSVLVLKSSNDTTENSTRGLEDFSNSANTGRATSRISSTVSTHSESSIRPSNVLRGLETQGNGVVRNSVACTGCLFQANYASNSLIQGTDIALILDAVIFRENEFFNSAIALEKGSFSMRESCLEGSTSKGALISSNDSEVTVVDAYFSKNSGLGCSGYLDPEGKCVSFTSGNLCIADQKRCYSDWLDLSNALSIAVKGSIFTICQDAVLNVDNNPPIKISSRKVSIRCGMDGSQESNCLIEGGQLHFVIAGSSSDVTFSGITFSGASMFSVHASGSKSSIASFVDCVFKEISAGQAAIFIYNGDIQSLANNTAKVDIRDYNEPSEFSMRVEMSYTNFVSNKVELAPITNLKGTVIITNCKFSANTGLVGAIGVWYQGKVSMSNSCFIDNVGMKVGTILIEGSELDEEKSYSSGNTVTDGDCPDTFLRTSKSSGDCVKFKTKSCQAKEAPSLPPSGSSVLPDGETPSSIQFDCVDHWSDLESVIANASIGVESIFKICPNTKLQVGKQPISLNQSKTDIWIECGQSGRLKDNCVITGGNYHFRIFGAEIQVSFRGITFEKSKKMSIIGAADSTSQVSFDECQWTGHRGQGVIFIYNDALGQVYDGETPLDQFQISDNSMRTSLKKSVFFDNLVEFSIIYNVGGVMGLSTTSFKGNYGLSSSTIVALSGATLSLERCCFIENDSVSTGAIRMSEDCLLEQNEENFAYSNGEGITGCTDIWSSVTPLKCSSQSCPGTCLDFDATYCNIPGFEFDAPSSTPSSFDFTTPFVSGPPSRSAFDSVETSLLSSGYYIKNLVVSGIISVVGFLAFFYCKNLHEPKKGKKSQAVNVKAVEGVSDAPSVSEEFARDESDQSKMAETPKENGVLLDPDILPVNEKAKNKLSGFFARQGKKIKDPQSTEQRTVMSSNGAQSMPSSHNFSYSYGNENPFDGDDGDDDDTSGGIPLT